MTFVAMETLLPWQYTNFAITRLYVSLYLAHMSLGTKCGARLLGYYGNHCNHENKELCNKNMRKYFEFIFGTNILCDSIC